MGGFGSGRYSSRAKVEGSSVLDINRMIKLGAIVKQGSRKGGRWQWCNNETGEVVASITYISDTLDENNLHIKLSYTLTDQEKDMDYVVRITKTRTQFGGERFWFVCPARHVRVSKLYLPYGGDIFASRQAYDLRYASQSKSPLDRALQRKWNLVHKVNEDGEYWLKPKGMHWKTFHALIDRIEEADRKSLGFFIPFVEKLMNKAKPS